MAKDKSQRHKGTKSLCLCGPQWYGETIGFWDGNTLVAWTANVIGWTMSHSMFEYSNSLEIVEVFTPNANGNGINVDATFYDPEA